MQCHANQSLLDYRVQEEAGALIGQSGWDRTLRVECRRCAAIFPSGLGVGEADADDDDRLEGSPIRSLGGFIRYQCHRMPAAGPKFGFPLPGTHAFTYIVAPKPAPL